MMLKKLILLLVLSYSGGALMAADKYPAAAIPAHLLKQAGAVKRMEHTTFRIVDAGETVTTTRYAITILNEKGDGYASLVEYYSKLRQVKSIEGRLYDAEGKLLKTLKSKEVLDLSAVDDNNLIDDNRRKFHQFHYKTYPYTVEYEVETKSNNTMFFPAWIPQEGQYLSVEQSSFTVICPESYELRYRAYNHSATPVIGSGKNSKTYTWETKELPALTRPFASPAWHELTTVVYFGPTKFEIEGYKGNMSSWNEIGKFQYTLNARRDDLPDAVAKKVKELTGGVTDPAEKVRILYKYLQQNTRYVSIQLGIGGWRPLEASFVAQKGYGDCKALTNYMFAMLKEAGIPSNPVLIQSGDDPDYFIEDFPSVRFNHVILCVPMATDTIWLECTSQSAPAGYLGTGTCNRKALLIDEKGGVVVTTPSYTQSENTLKRQLTAKLETNGTLNLKAETLYGGLQQDFLSMMIHQYSKEKIEKHLQESLELSTYHVNDFDYGEIRGARPQLKEELDVTVNGYATISGKRIFITPNILNRNGSRMQQDTTRKVDLVFHYPYRDEDHYEISIPEGYELEAVPADIRIKSPFGNYSAVAKLQDNKLVYHRVMERFSGRFAASQQAELVQFFADIYKADRSRMVLVKKAE